MEHVGSSQGGRGFPQRCLTDARLVMAFRLCRIADTHAPQGRYQSSDGIQSLTFPKGAGAA